MIAGKAKENMEGSIITGAFRKAKDRLNRGKVDGKALSDYNGVNLGSVPTLPRLTPGPSFDRGTQSPREEGLGGLAQW